MFEFSPFIRKPVNCFQFGHVFLEDYKSRGCGMTGLFHQSVRDLLYRAECVNTLFYDDVLSHLFFFKIVLQFRDTRQFDNRQKQFQCKPPSPKSEDAHVIIKESKDLIFFPEEAVFSVGDLVKVFRSLISDQSSTGYSHVFGDLYIKPFGLFEVSINMVNMPTYQSTC